MPNDPKKLSQFWQELKRRKVVHVIVVYGTIAYGSIELVNNVYQTLNFPDWTPLLVLIVLASGYPLAIVLSWFFDITSEGIVRTPGREVYLSMTSTIPADNKPSPFENSIAVLPFQDMSPDREQEYFCDGIAEEIINILANIGKLKVIARTSSFAFKNTQTDIREIGKMLGVNTLLEGSIRKSGNKLRITAQLIKVSDGSHMWSQKYDRDIRDIFEIQDEISSAIVKSLEIRLFSEEGSIATAYMSNNVDAFLLYLKGLYHGQNTRKAETVKAIEYFEEALKLDAGFALGYIGLASAFWSLTFWGNIPPNQAYPVILDKLAKAQKLTGDHADIFYLRALSNFSYLWNMKEAEANFAKALKMNPSSASYHSAYSIFLTSSARHEEAITEAKLAAELDPMSAYYSSLVANAYNFAGSFDQAIKHCRDFEKRFPSHFFFAYFLGFALQGKSRLKEAVAEYERAMELSGGAQLVITNLISAFIELGKIPEAERWISELQELSKKNYVLPSHFYKAFRLMGEEDLAFEWFERAIKDHDSFMPLIRHHIYKKMRIPDEPRYMDLLNISGL